MHCVLYGENRFSCETIYLTIQKIPNQLKKTKNKVLKICLQLQMSLSSCCFHLAQSQEPHILRQEKESQTSLSSKSPLTSRPVIIQNPSPHLHCVHPTHICINCEKTPSCGVNMKCTVFLLEFIMDVKKEPRSEFLMCLMTSVFWL